MLQPLIVVWRVGKTLGRTLYLDEQCVGMLDDPRLARAVVEGLALLEGDDLGDDDLWRARLTVWRLRVRALRLEALRRRSPGDEGAAPPRARAARRAPRLARR